MLKQKIGGKFSKAFLHFYETYNTLKKKKEKKSKDKLQNVDSQ